MNKEELYSKAKDAYYNGEQIMSDIEFDALEVEIGLDNKGYIGTHHQKSYTIEHPFLMGSLSKIQIKFDKNDGTIHFNEYIPQIKSYLNKSNSVNHKDWYFEITPKYDGCSWEAVIDGDCNLVSCSTRGDGEYGKDIKHWFQSYFDKVISPYLDNFFDNNYDDTSKFSLDKFVIRGECLIRKDIFKKKYLGDFKMPRSFVAGCLGQDWEGTPKQIEMRDDLDWVCYDYRTKYDNGSVIEIDYSGSEDSRKREYLPTYSYENIPGVKPSILDCNMYLYPYNCIDKFEMIYTTWEEYRKNCPYELDGFVIKPGAHYRLQDGTRTRQEDCVAIKFTPEIVDARIKDIEWNVGKTGEYYPTGILETIKIGGKDVNRVSLANYDSIVKKGTGLGANVRVSLAGDIIPFIYEVTKESIVINTPLDSYMYTVVDDNGRRCIHLVKEMNEEQRNYVKFINSIKVIRPNGIGEAVAKKLFDIFKTDNILDFMIDSNRDWTNSLDESKSSTNIIKSLDERKLTITLIDVIQSLGYNNCGEKNATWLAKKISGIDTDTKGIPNSIILLSLDSKFNKLVKHYVENLNVPYLIEDKSSSDKIPVILTGAPSVGTKAQWLKEHPQYIETTSWKEVKILMTNDLNSTSSKMTKAKKNGISIKLYEDDILYW